MAQQITQDDMNAAARGLTLAGMTIAALEELAARHASSDLFASRVIVAAVKQMIAAKRQVGASAPRRVTKVEFDAIEYEWAHGHRPRGYGCWAFSPRRKIDVLSDEVIWINGESYGEAKKKAAEIAKSRGVDYLFVLS